MSIAVMSRLFKAQLGSPSRKMLAIRLGDFADDDGRGIWPTVGRLAHETELSERTVQRLLKDFVDEGLLVVVSEGGGRPGTSTRYDFNMTKLASFEERKSALDGCHHVTGDTMTPVTLDAERGDTDDREGCHHVTRTVIEPLDKPLSERARESGKEIREERKATERSFKKAFSAWPTFLSDSEPDAYRAWGSLSVEDRQSAFDEAGRYVEAARATGRKHICSFAVYLREKRWEKLPAQAAAALDAPTLAPPFGKMWSAQVYEQLLAGSIQIGNLSPIERRLVEDGKFTAQHLLMEKQAKQGFPVVNELFERAASRRGARVPAWLQPVAERMVPVKVGDDLWCAWIAEHTRRGWPWPDVGRMEYVHLPAGGPDALNDLQDQLRGLKNDNAS